MTVTKRHHTAALALANRARVKLGRKPVKRLKKGAPQEPDRCAIAQTIGEGVLVFPNNAFLNAYAYDGVPIVVIDAAYDDWDGEKEGLIAKGGTLAQEFALAFDEGDIPELVQS